jgi:hypothetical protein
MFRRLRQRRSTKSGDESWRLTARYDRREEDITMNDGERIHSGEHPGITTSLGTIHGLLQGV